MVQPVRAELLTLIQASLGWAVLAVRAAGSARAVDSAPEPLAPPVPTGSETPVRLRATITIDIDACDAGEAARRSDIVRGQFEALKRAHPLAQLTFQRRRPRSGPRSPTPSLVVAPYADD